MILMGCCCCCCCCCWVEFILEEGISMLRLLLVWTKYFELCERSSNMSVSKVTWDRERIEIRFYAQ